MSVRKRAAAKPRTKPKARPIDTSLEEAERFAAKYAEGDEVPPAQPPTPKRKRKKRAAKTTEPSKVGRPRAYTATTLKTHSITMTDEQREALEKHVEKVNEGRREQGLQPLSFASWAREALLLVAGLDHLTEAGALRAKLAKLEGASL